MFDFTAILAEVANWFTSALALVDPTTAMGGLLFAALASGVALRIIRGIRRVIPK